MTRRFALALLLAAAACHRNHGDAYKVAQLAAHGAHACAAMVDGTVRCWGRQGDHARLEPVVVPGSNVAQVCGGDDFTCTRTRAGDVACLGQELHGASDLACGDRHACAVVGGAVQCWKAETSPATVPGTSGAKSIAAGGGTSGAVFGDGTAKCWGRGTRGQLGNGAFVDSDVPVPVLGLDVKSIAVGEEHACAVLRDETVACFGANDDGQLGDGTTEASAAPKKATGVNIASEIACGAHHTCVRLGDSTAWCWGKNDVHQSGIAADPDLLVPTRVIGLYEATGVAAGDDFTCARMQDGWLRCFGVNDWGQLGDGTTDLRNVPTPIKF